MVPLLLLPRARPGKCILSCGRCDLVTSTGAEKEQNAFVEGGGKDAEADSKQGQKN